MQAAGEEEFAQETVVGDAISNGGSLEYYGCDGGRAGCRFHLPGTCPGESAVDHLGTPTVLPRLPLAHQAAR